MNKRELGLPEVMERMRHKDERMTLRVYAKVMRSRQSQVDTALDEVLSAPKLLPNGVSDTRDAEAVAQKTPPQRGSHESG